MSNLLGLIPYVDDNQVIQVIHWIFWKLNSKQLGY
jgi:hypothetical protein